MHKPLLLAGAFLCALLSYAQKKDTLILLYQPDQFTLSKQYTQKLDSFLLQGWDKISINGYTDETEGDEYNLELSKKRSGKVYDYLLSKGVAREAVGARYFGESIQLATDDSTGDQRMVNRRTEIIGYRYARIKLAPKTDPMAPVTMTLDNGFIITYRPGSLPEDMAANFASGSGINFQLISNTLEMRQNNLFNNTTRGEILSSVLIVCGEQSNPCKLDSPVLVKVPIPFATNCPLEKVKFFNAVAEKGKRIWQEESKSLYPETINGKQYIRLWMNNFCGCINFDFKVDPECYATDSTQFIVNATIKNLTAELKGFNSVYLPRKVNDSARTLLFMKDKLTQAPITFTLFDGKRRIRTFRDQPLTVFPYDQENKSYMISTGNPKLYFPRLKVYDVVLKVNGEKYRVSPEKNRYQFVYLNRKTETILVDFLIKEPGGKFSYYKDQPLESLPYDEVRGYRVIDKKFLKLLKQKEEIARM